MCQFLVNVIFSIADTAIVGKVDSSCVTYLHNRTITAGMYYSSAASNFFAYSHVINY